MVLFLFLFLCRWGQSLMVGHVVLIIGRAFAAVEGNDPRAVTIVCAYQRKKWGMR